MKTILTLFLFLPMICGGGATVTELTEAHSRTILLIGDSITHHTADMTVYTDAAPPPGAVGYAKALWDSYAGQKPEYRLLDSEVFSESGAWKTAMPETDYPRWWSDNFGRQTATRYSSDPAATVSFEIEAGNYALLYRRMKGGGAARVTASGAASFSGCDVSIGGGGGTIPNPSQCVANYRIEGDHNNTQVWVRIDILSSEQQTITVGSLGTGYISYIGLEKSKDKRPFRIINMGRAGHNVDELSMFFEDDISPLLGDVAKIVFQVPIFNELNDKHAARKIADNALGYLARLEGHQVIVILPHYRASFVSGNTEIAGVAETYDLVRGEIEAKGYQVVDVREVFAAQASAAHRTLQDEITAVTKDGTHLNETGAKIYSDALISAGLFDSIN